MYGRFQSQRKVFDSIVDNFIPGRAGSAPPTTHIQNAPVEDYLSPRFSHQLNDQKYLAGKPYEFGIAIAYWPLLGHQTSNAEFDTRYIRHNQPLKEQVGNQGMFDCPARAPMPDDLPGETPLLELARDEPTTWENMPLYTEICSGTVPVMIHHNSVDKWWREKQWDKPWWHGRSREMLEEKRKAGLPMLMDGVATDTGALLSWDELCPREVDKELFRDVDDPPKQE